jgi:hypothetical protein
MRDSVLKCCNNVTRGPTDPFFEDMMLQTVGPGYQGGMMMDGSAKIAQDPRERQIVRSAVPFVSITYTRGVLCSSFLASCLPLLSLCVFVTLCHPLLLSSSLPPIASQLFFAATSTIKTAWVKHVCTSPSVSATLNSASILCRRALIKC